MQDQWGNTISISTSEDGLMHVFSRDSDGQVVEFPASLSIEDATEKALSSFNGMLLFIE